MNSQTPVDKEASAPAEAKSGSVPFWRRLSTKLLVLTVGFVLIAEL